MLQRSSHFQTDDIASPDIGRRRAIFASLVTVTVMAVLALAVAALSAGGFGFVDGILVALFALTLPWTVVGFWNAAIGFILARFSQNPPQKTYSTAAPTSRSVTASTAILLCIRNEDPARVLRNLHAMLTDIVDSGQSRLFHLYILSDTNDPELDALEQKEFGRLADTWRDRIAITYRRREQNTGYKAGNIGDS